MQIFIYMILASTDNMHLIYIYKNYLQAPTTCKQTLYIYEDTNTTLA